jgi:hypothetical protein
MAGKKIHLNVQQYSRTDQYMLRVRLNAAGSVENGLKSNSHNVVSISNLAGY